MIINGDSLKELPKIQDNSIDSIVTDPPYELGFMGKKWDNTGIAYNTQLWKECLRVLKPGGHLLAFGGTRTYHRMAVAIEDAGFEIRDSLHWLYGSGFPKSLNVSKAIDKAAGAEREVVGSRKQRKRPKSHDDEFQKNTSNSPIELLTAPATDAAKQWEGFGTALKPAHEPIVVARKPLTGTVAANVLEHGTGALNIDGCRVGFESEADEQESKAKNQHADFGTEPGGNAVYGDYSMVPAKNYNPPGRWPANLVFTHAADCVCVNPGGTEAVREMGEVSDIRGGNYAQGVEAYADRPKLEREVTMYKDTPAVWRCAEGCPVAELDGQNENASRFFTVTEWHPIADVAPFRYVAKPSKKERNAGLDGMPEGPRVVMASGGRTMKDGVWVETHSEPQPRANHHPTVKPINLMRWLVRLVTPPGGTVLDPFAGSGTTLVAAVLEGFDAIGIEMTKEYIPIIQARIEWAQNQQTEPTLPLEGG